MALRVRCCNCSDAVGSRVSQLRNVRTHHEASKIGSVALRSLLREWPPLENLVLLGHQDMNTEGGKSHKSTYFFPACRGFIFYAGLDACNSDSACSREEAEGRVQRDCPLLV